jgi:hypothetical protein
MAYAQPSGSFLHATLYSSLPLQVSRELCPAQPFVDCRRMSAASWTRKRASPVASQNGRLTPKASQSSLRSRCRRKLAAKRLRREQCWERSHQKGRGRGSMPRDRQGSLGSH